MLHATQTFFSEQKLFKQHGTIKTYLDTKRQQHQLYYYLEYFSNCPGLQQQNQAVPLMPHRKTLLNQSQEAVFIKQVIKTNFEMSLRE